MGIGISAFGQEGNYTVKSDNPNKSKSALYKMAKSFNAGINNLFGIDNRTTSEKIDASKKEIERLEGKLENLDKLGRKGNHTKRKLQKEKEKLADYYFLLNKQDQRAKTVLNGIRDILAENQDRRTTLGQISVLFDSNPPIDDDKLRAGYISSDQKSKNLKKNMSGSEYKLLKIKEILAKGGDEQVMFGKIEKIWYGDAPITSKRYFDF